MDNFKLWSTLFRTLENPTWTSLFLVFFCALSCKIIHEFNFNKKTDKKYIRGTGSHCKKQKSSHCKLCNDQVGESQGLSPLCINTNCERNYSSQLGSYRSAPPTWKRERSKQRLGKILQKKHYFYNLLRAENEVFRV